MTRRWLLLFQCSLALLCAASNGVCAVPAPRPTTSLRLELADAAASDPSLRALLARDRQWLASQPHVPVGAPADSVILHWLQQVERSTPRPASPPQGMAPADDEPLRGHRDPLSALRDRWLARGYLAVRIERSRADEADPSGSRWIARVDPGPKFKVREVVVTGDVFAGRQAVLDSWMPRPGDPFQPEFYLDAAASVVLECAERGYPFPIWMTRSIHVDPEAGEVSVAAVLMPGPLMVVGPQRSNLDRGRGEAFLIKAAGLQSGRVFRESDLRRGRQRLEARGMYTRVDEPMVHMTAADDTVGVVWRVEPMQRANRLSVVLGLSRRDEGGARLSGQVDLSLPNMAGTGRQLSARWRDDGRSRSLFSFRYMEPLIFGTPLDADLALESEVLLDAYTLFKVRNSWRLPVVGFWGLELGMGWDRTTYPAGEFMGARRVRWRAGVVRQRGDPAHSGWSGSFAVEAARRSTQLRPAQSQDSFASALASVQLGRQDRQRLLEIDLDGELWLRREMSLSGRASFRQIDTEARPIPLPELYRFGGAGSLRGYREDAFLGEIAAWGGVELRFGRARRSRVYTFVDVGYFERTTRLPADAGGGFAVGSGIHAGYGLGLLTLAAPGQINLAVGFPGSVDFDAAMLHVSLQGGF